MNTAQHTGVIYMLTNQITDERYVGRTNNFPKRMSRYKNGRGHGDIGRAIAKYGWENFVVVKLEQGISDADLPSREDYYITKLNPEINLMTSTAGGRMRHAESSKRKASKSMLGKNAGKPAWNKGKTTPPFVRAKISASNTGKSPSLETRAKLSAAGRGERNHNYGKKLGPLSAAHRAKLSAAQSGENNHNFGKTPSLETRARMSASHLGKKLSPETIAKRTATRRANKQKARTTQMII